MIQQTTNKKTQVLVPLAGHAQICFHKTSIGCPSNAQTHKQTQKQTNKQQKQDEMCRDEICPGMKGVVNLVLIPLAGHAQVCFLKTSIGCPINWGN